MTKPSRKPSFQVLQRGTINQVVPPSGMYKVYCPKCDQAAIASLSVLRCPYCGQVYCPPSQPRVFR